MKAHDIISDVAEKRGVLVADIKSKGRSHELVKAPIEIATRLRLARGLTDGQIAVLLNKCKWSVRYYRIPAFRQQQIEKVNERDHARASA